MTQLDGDLDGDLDDLRDAWYSGRSVDERPARREPPTDEPLFEQLRVAYLRGEETGQWTPDEEATGWVRGDEDEEDLDTGRWMLRTGRGMPSRQPGRREPAGDTAAWSPAEEAGEWADDRDGGWSGEEAWPVQAPPRRRNGHRRPARVRRPPAPRYAADPDELDEDEEQELFEEAARGRGRGAARGRISRRRTTALLNASTVLIAAAVVVVGAGLSVLVVSSRLLTTRQLFFAAHSMFGIVLVHAFGGGLGTLLTTGESRLKDRIRKLSTVAMAVVAWLASATGTWFGYAGYRASMPPGGNIELYPQQYLLHSPGLRFWDTFAMEWKIHIGWTTPFLATAVAFVALRYRARLVADSQVRKVLTNLFIIAFAGAVIAAVLGAMVNTTAPNDFMHRGWHP